MKYILICFMAVCLMSFSGCGKNCKDASYQFKMDESFHPEKDSIHYGFILPILQHLPILQVILRWILVIRK
jgi:hypothetical protein